MKEKLNDEDQTDLHLLCLSPFLKICFIGMIILDQTCLSKRMWNCKMIEEEHRIVVLFMLGLKLRALFSKAESYFKL